MHEPIFTMCTNGRVRSGCRRARSRPAPVRSSRGSTRFAAALLLAGLCLAACGRGDREGFLGSALLETETHQIASTVQGRLAAVLKREGDAVRSGELLAVVDTVALVLRLEEAAASRAELEAALAAGKSEVGALRKDLDGLKRELERVRPLAAQGAVPSQRRDELETRLSAAQSRLEAARRNLAGLEAKGNAIDARMAQVRNAIGESYLRAPRNGRLLTQFKRQDEVLGPGQPVFEMGREDTLQVDFYVPQYLLAGLNAGSRVNLRVDLGPEDEEAAFLPATVTWLSREAEFSPKNIQTRESRHELVFRVRALAANRDGLLKRGLPVEVWRAQPPAAEEGSGIVSKEGG